MKMHSFFAGLLSVALLSACGDGQKKTESESQSDTTATVSTAAPMSKDEIGKAYQVEGDTISPEGAITPAELEQQLASKDGLDLTVKSEVESACQVKGCWMKVKLPSGQLMHVTFKDYGFFVPKDVPGKEVVFQGHAYHDTLSVQELQHYAEDDGKSEKEIAAITKPEVTVLFNANGVLIPKVEEAKKL